jgi:hypothetical protein
MCIVYEVFRIILLISLGIVFIINNNYLVLLPLVIFMFVFLKPLPHSSRRTRFFLLFYIFVLFAFSSISYSFHIATLFRFFFYTFSRLIYNILYFVGIFSSSIDVVNSFSAEGLITHTSYSLLLTNAINIGLMKIVPQFVALSALFYLLFFFFFSIFIYNTRLSMYVTNNEYNLCINKYKSV